MQPSPDANIQTSSDVKLKWLPIDQMFKINKLGLLKKVINGRAPECLITSFSLQTQNLSYEKEFNALNLELTISFTLMKTTLINNTASNFTVDTLKLKSYYDFYFFLNIIVNRLSSLLIYLHSFLTFLNF